MSQYSNYFSFKWEKPMEWETFNPNNAPDRPGFYVLTNFDGQLKPTTRSEKKLSFMLVKQLTFAGDWESIKTKIWILNFNH